MKRILFDFLIPLCIIAPLLWVCIHAVLVVTADTAANYSVKEEVCQQK